MRILLAHPDPESLRYLEALLGGKGRRLDSFACVESALAARGGDFDLAVLCLDGGWQGRGEVEDHIERTLAPCRIFWLAEDASAQELGASIPEELLNYCLPGV